MEGGYSTQNRDEGEYLCVFKGDEIKRISSTARFVFPPCKRAGLMARLLDASEGTWIRSISSTWIRNRWILFCVVLLLFEIFHRPAVLSCLSRSGWL